jgi:hypothetical protein
LLGGDAPGAQNPRSRRPIDDRVGDARRCNYDQIGDCGGLKFSARRAESFIRFARRQREGAMAPST